MKLYLFLADKTYIFRSVSCTVISKNPPRIVGVMKPRFNTYLGFRDVCQRGESFQLAENAKET